MKPRPSRYVACDISYWVFLVNVGLLNVLKSGVEYLLDTLLNGDISDRAFFITDYGKKVSDIERRLKQLDRNGEAGAA